MTFNLISKKRVKILTIDLENRPLSYWVPLEPTAEITAIATCWVGYDSSMQVLLLGRDDPVYMLTEFLKRYNEADIVTGHYIRKHDLPIINGALMEYGLPQLTPKLTSDTRMDMRKKKGIPATQEYLSDILALPMDKFKMGQDNWRTANRLIASGIDLTAKRVSSDVRQHALLRAAMLERGLLGPPRVWRP